MDGRVKPAMTTPKVPRATLPWAEGPGTAAGQGVEERKAPGLRCSDGVEGGARVSPRVGSRALGAEVVSGAPKRPTGRVGSGFGKPIRCRAGSNIHGRWVTTPVRTVAMDCGLSESRLDRPDNSVSFGFSFLKLEAKGG